MRSPFSFCLSGARGAAGAAGTALSRLAAGAVTLTVISARLRREELVGGEINAAEHVTRTVGARRCALFLRNAEIVRGNQHLHIAGDLNDRKQAEGDINTAAARVVKAASVMTADPLRDTAAGIAVRAAILNISGKTDRLRHLYGCLRLDTAAGGLRGLTGCIGAEGLDVAFAAVQDHFFIKDRNTAYHNRGSRRSRAYVQANVEEERHIDGVKALIERHRLQIEIDRNHVHTAQMRAGGIGNQFTFVRGKVDAQVFQTILITATDAVSNPWLPVQARADMRLPLHSVQAPESTL